MLVLPYLFTFIFINPHLRIYFFSLTFLDRMEGEGDLGKREKNSNVRET